MLREVMLSPTQLAENLAEPDTPPHQVGDQAIVVTLLRSSGKGREYSSVFFLAFNSGRHGTAVECRRGRSM